MVKIFIEPSGYEQEFDGRELMGLDWRRVSLDKIDVALDDVCTFHPDAVLVCGWSTPLSRAACTFDFGCRKIFAFDMPWEWSFRKFVARWLLRPRLKSFDAAFVPGKRTLRYAQWLGFRGRVATGSNPSGWERFSAKSPSASGFLFVGRLTPDKGLDVLLKAYALYREMVDCPWTISIVGSGEIDIPNVEGVRVVGFVQPDRMPDIMGEHAALVLPSRWEPWGIVALEAMSAGLSTIASEACGFTDDVEPTVKVKIDDVEGVAKAMVRMHGMSVEERKVECIRAKQMAKRYSAQKWCERLERLAFPRIKVADFWEDHCVECGEPACFKTCPKFRHGAHGRCERIVFGNDGKVFFREWGKLELLWHGRSARPETEERLKAWNSRLEPVAKFLQILFGWLPLPYGKGPYGIFRSIRWRKARRMAEFVEAPTIWLLEISAERPTALVFEVRDKEKNILLSRTIGFDGEMTNVSIALPPVKEGALFSVHPVGGEATVGMVFERNELVVEAQVVKCVAWDLDGVVWHGTLSEGDDVCVDGQVLNVIKELDALGIVSSICSKNDEEIAITKLKELGIEEWFVFPQINWGPKSESLKRIAREMNIGLDSIAFVDDRAENRNEVKDRLPEVSVFSEADVSSLVSSLASVGEAVTGPGTLGSERRRMYREEMKRRRAFDCFDGDAEAFSSVSGLEFEMLAVDGERRVRCRELAQRTNQLNLTARRYDEKAFDELVKSYECRAVRVWDKYGDYGIVGFVAWRGTHLVECCFSCRVAKRGIERKVLDRIAGGRCFTADVVETARNEPIRKIVEEWMEEGRHDG